MGALQQLRKIDNLNRAWRWIRSNPDATFKSYFRSLYQNYAVAEDALLKDLQDRLKRGVYEPEVACKLFHPKSSGILRPYSLLTVEDQIVYQAATNLVAEKLFPKVKHRYFKQIFGHLYAGKSGVWFYRKWSDGYKTFNDVARKAFKDGYAYTASFDLTACYDSLDHRVLRHFLANLGFDPEFCKKLTDWLEQWTATEQGIFHNHGIPQGPISSGLLSEVVLSNFDTLKIKGVDFKYFRYVDDVRLFARNEYDLRRLLVGLDLISKDIGLFPQSGKISIHRIANIESELKTVSNPPEAAITRLFVDQKTILKRITKLTPGYRIVDSTRFKYLLAHANPSSKLTARLWRILDLHPEIYRSVCNYLRRYDKLPRVPAEKLVDVIKENSLYQSVRAEFINACDRRLPEAQESDLAKFLKDKCWTPRSLHPDILAVTGQFLISTGNLTPRQICYACRTAKSWWTRAKLIEELRKEDIGEYPLAEIVSTAVKDYAKDVALAGAWKAFQHDCIPEGSRNKWNQSGLLLLRETGSIQRATSGYCGIETAFKKIDKSIPVISWRKLFGSLYSQAERQAIEIGAASTVNITGFVNLLDVFNDLLIDAVFKADGQIGTYELGKIGSVLYAPTGGFATKYPKTYELCKAVHDSRYESMLSHPLIKRTGKPTRKINYRFLGKSKKLMKAAFMELSQSRLLK